MARTPLVLSGAEPSDPRRGPRADYSGSGWSYLDRDISDPLLAEFLRGGHATASGATVSPWRALTNTAVLRAVLLISSSIGMLPLSLIDQETKQKAVKHPLYRLLKREPNNFQTAYDFRCLMEHRVLRRGNAYARVVRGRGLKAGDPQALLPMDPDLTTPRQNSDLSISYVYRSPSGGTTTFDPGDVLHLRSFSLDGINGVSLVDLAKEAIGLALQAERATARIFRNGSFVDGALQTDNKLSDQAFDRLRASWDQRYGGADQAGKTPILEEGLKYQSIAQTAKDAQSIETRKMQVEEVARVFGVPRPLLMVDETSWGSGIEALGQFFVTYALQPQFSVWEQGVERSLLRDSEKDTLAAKFNPGALLHGSMADQATFFSNALGSGGHAPWMTPNEVRDLMDLPSHPDGDSLTNPMTAKAADPAKEPAADDPPAPGSHLRVV